MEIAEKLATLATQDDDKQSENTTQCILHKNTNNVNKGKNKLPNTGQSSKGKGKTHKSTNRQNQSTSGKLGNPQ
jgi:hypothetical protein